MEKDERVPLLKDDAPKNLYHRDRYRSSQGSTEDSYEKTDGLHCGYGPCHPPCLQRFNNSKALLACVCAFTFTHGFIINGLTGTNTSTLERRFNLPSTSVAWIASSHEIAAAGWAILFGYLGASYHKGRLLAISAVGMACGSLVMSLPHFLVGPYRLASGVEEQESTLCQASTEINQTDCGIGTQDSGLSNYLYVFIAGQCLHAVATGCMYTLAIPYLDENIEIHNTPVYIGIMFAFATVGPSLGFSLGGQLLTLYVDIDKLGMGSPPVALDDPRWVGAWWISYLISATMSVLVAALVACFPPALQGNKRCVLQSHKKVDEVKKQKTKRPSSTEPSDKKHGALMGILLGIKSVFSNASFVFLMLAATTENGATYGFAAFFPKLLQFQFGQSPISAGLFAGVLTILGGALGQLLGGIIPRVLRLNVKGLMRQVFICLVIAGCFGFSLLLRCPTPPMAGINMPYNNRSDGDLDLLSECNTGCGCNTGTYEPVCSNDGLAYISPCYAGCTTASIGDQGQVLYEGCRCLTNGSSQTVADDCQTSDCLGFYLFLPLYTLLSLFVLMANSVGMAAITRILPDQQKTMGFGIYWTFIRLLGNVPSPVFMGLLIDTSCTVWQELCDGSRGACWLYDTKTFSYRMVALTVGLKLLGIINVGLAMWFYKPSPLDMPKALVMEVDLEGTQEVNREEAEKQLETAATT